MLEESISEAEIEEIVSKLSDHKKEHLRAVMWFLLKCYRSEHTYNGLLLVQNTDSKVALISLNSDEEEAVHMMTRAMEMIVGTYEEVPPKNQLN